MVLAGGEGARLRSLVHLVHGEPLPKQFAILIGSRSLLQTTIDRVSAIAPPSRTMVVVNRGQDALARRQLADWPDLEIILQPQNRGTALGILLALARLRRRDPDAFVAIFPSDHYVPRPEPFVEGVCAMAHSSGGVALLGLVPDRADPDLGWIVPDQPLASGLLAIARFIEKPDRAAAARLFRGGALWNAFVIVGRVRELWSLVTAHVGLAAAFEDAVEPAAIDALYQGARSADFSREVLEKARGLEVARVEGSGWADWGTPERVIDSLDGTPALDPLLRRIIDGQRRGCDLASRALLRHAE